MPYSRSAAVTVSNPPATGPPALLNRQSTRPKRSTAAVAAPMPLVAPVITATLPSSRPTVSFPLLSRAARSARELGNHDDAEKMLRDQLALADARGLADPAAGAWRP